MGVDEDISSLFIEDSARKTCESTLGSETLAELFGNVMGTRGECINSQGHSHQLEVSEAGTNLFPLCTKLVTDGDLLRQPRQLWKYK